MFEQLKLIVYSELEMNDSWWVSHVWLFRRNTAAWHSSLLSHALLQWNDSIWGVNNSKLSPRLSFIPIQLGLQVYILELLHSHFIKLQPRLDSKRNRRWRRLETKHVEIITKHCLLLFAPSIKRYSRNRIDSKYHYHASAYSLQTICCRFIYLHEENANADDTDNSSRLPGWTGNPMTAGAQQPISAIAAGDSAVTPPSTLDNGGRPVLRKRRRVV